MRVDNLLKSSNQPKYKQIKKRTRGKLKRRQLKACKASRLALRASLMTHPVITWQLSLCLKYQLQLMVRQLPSLDYRIKAQPR